MAVTTRSFGKTKKGEEVTLYRITNAGGMAAEVIDFGANLVSLFVPDKNGQVADVVLGFDRVEDYEFNPCFFGSVIGRSANRIAGAECEIDGRIYKLQKNDGENNLHSHFDECFNKKMFKGSILSDGTGVKLSVFSPDGDQGFPGNLSASIIYKLTDTGELQLIYEASTDADTIYNVTNHSYFNLAGHASGSAMEHTLQLNASRFTPTVPGSIPTGEWAPVAGTPFDFTTEETIGTRIDADNPQLKMAGGYDHNYCIDTDGGCTKIAVLTDPASGRSMTVYTDLPGVQFYAGNFITPMTGKGGASYGKRNGVCLETQYFPDAIHQPGFAGPVLKAGETFYSVTKYCF